MPANGLIYAPQHSCGCNPESLITGFNALSPRPAAGKGMPALEKGPAYGTTPRPQHDRSKAEWPTYRRDTNRSGYQDLPAPVKPRVAWTRQFSPPVTAPVVAGGLAVVAETDRHTLHAVSATDGEPVWTFVADGRIDSPPTLYGGLCLFGTRSGFVYCVRTSDGVLVWRFRAANTDQRLFAYEQLESVWPVHGSVLVDDTLSDGIPTAYTAAGRSSSLDGGIGLYALDVRTGKIRHKASVNPTAEKQGQGIIGQYVLPDILSIQKKTVWMRNMGVDRRLTPVKDLPHVYAPRGFLDDTWWHRTYWIYDTEMRSGYFGWAITGTTSPAGRLLTFDDAVFYGYGRMANPDYAAPGLQLEKGLVRRDGRLVHPNAGHVDPNATRSYKLFAEVPGHKPATGAWENWQRQIKWSRHLPFLARSLVLTRDALLVAGGGSLTKDTDRHGPGTFWVASRTDGSKMAACVLPAPPVLDGMALAHTGAYVSTLDGSLIRITDADESY